MHQCYSLSLIGLVCVFLSAFPKAKSILVTACQFRRPWGKTLIRAILASMKGNDLIFGQNVELKWGSTFDIHSEATSCLFLAVILQGGTFCCCRNNDLVWFEIGFYASKESKHNSSVLHDMDFLG